MSLTVNVSEIEHQLRLFQHDLSPNEARTSLFNLVIYTPGSKMNQVSETVNYLMGKRPSRVIIVNTDRKGAAGVHVSARCVEDSDLRQVCIQEIIITAGTEGEGENPSSWSSLLIKGIPTFLWYKHPLPARAADLLSLVEDHVDRILIDSQEGGEVRSFLTSYRTLNHPLPLSDFNWSRLYPLMKLSALLFNPLEMRPRLHELKSLSFQGGDASQVWEYFLWFSSRMGWSLPPETQRNTWSGANTRGESVTFVHQNPDSLEKGFQIDFTSPDGAVSRLVSDKDGFALCTPAGKAAYTSVFHLPGDGEILLKEVDHSGSDRLFWDSLPH